jgi:hypothetical protein
MSALRDHRGPLVVATENPSSSPNLGKSRHCVWFDWNFRQTYQHQGRNQGRKSFHVCCHVRERATNRYPMLTESRAVETANSCLDSSRVNIPRRRTRDRHPQLKGHVAGLRPSPFVGLRPGGSNPTLRKSKERRCPAEIKQAPSRVGEGSRLPCVCGKTVVLLPSAHCGPCSSSYPYATPPKLGSNSSFAFLLPVVGYVPCLTWVLRRPHFGLR